MTRLTARRLGAIYIGPDRRGERASSNGRAVAIDIAALGLGFVPFGLGPSHLTGQIREPHFSREDRVDMPCCSHRLRNEMAILALHLRMPRGRTKVFLVGTHAPQRGF